jgi:hypothetical protein
VGVSEFFPELPEVTLDVVDFKVIFPFSGFGLEMDRGPFCVDSVDLVAG